MSVETNGAVDWHQSIAASFEQGYDRSPRFRERLRLWRGLIERTVQPGDRVLDAGCGAGTFSFEAAARGADVEAIDGSPAMIGLARKRQQELGIANIDFQTAMLDSLSTRPDGQYDVVLSSSVLEYLPDLDSEVSRLARILKPGGRLLLSMPNRQSLYRRLEQVTFKLTGKPRYFAHVRNLTTARELSDLFRKNGIDPIETHFYAAPPGDPLMTRVFGARRSKTLLVIAGRKR